MTATFSEETSIMGTKLAVYCASRASVPERPAMWKRLRSAGANIISTWIDEANAGETLDFTLLWERIAGEIALADRLVLYVEPGDLPLKGALVEVGIAVGLDKEVLIVAPGFDVALRDCAPFGSWAKHSRVRFVPDIEQAVGLLPGAADIPWLGAAKVPTIEEVLADQSASDWLKSTLRAAIQRDPVDAAIDADFLAKVLARHSKAALSCANALSRSRP